MNKTNYSWDIAISKSGLEISKVKVMSEFKGLAHIISSIQPMPFLFVSHQSLNHMAKIVFDPENKYIQIF